MASIVHPSFTVDEYCLLIESRIFPENRRIELIDGQLSEVPPADGRHVRCGALLNRILVHAIGDLAFLGHRAPFSFGERTVVQADMALLSRLPDSNESPQPWDAFLVIEVADASLVYDREVKAPLYAAAGIPEYWIADINHRQIIRHRQPNATGYQHVDVVGIEERLVAEQLPAIDIAVADVFA